MQGRDDAPRTNLDVLRDHRDGRAGYGGIRIEAAKFMKVPLRRPHRCEAVLVGKLCPLREQAIFVGWIFTLIGGEVEETEVDGPT